MDRGAATEESLWTSEGIRRSLLIGILLLAMFLRLWALDAKSLWQDEIFTAAIASTENTVFEVATIPLYNTALPAPPLYFLITHFLLYIADNDFLLRFPALVFGVLGVAMTYCLGARLFGKSEGLSGAFLLALSPFHVRYSQDARFYTLLVFLSVCSLYWFYRGIIDKDRKALTGFVICSVLNLYNQLFALLVLLAQTVFVAGLWLWEALPKMARYRATERGGDSERSAGIFDRSTGLAFVVGLAIIALSYVPMVPHLLRGLSGAKGLGAAVTRGMSFTASFLIRVLDTWGGSSGWGILVLSVPFVIGIAISARRHRRQLWLAFCWFVVPFGVLFAMPARHGFRPRYVIFMLPLYVLFVARGLTAAGEAISARVASRRLPVWEVSLGVFLLTIALFGLRGVRAYYMEDRANWRGVAALLARNVSAGEPIVSPGPFPQVVLPRYEGSLGEADFLMGGSDLFLSGDRAMEGGVWFVGPARDKMRAMHDELAEALPLFFRVVFEVDDRTAARGRALEIAPVMYNDLWVLYVGEDLQAEEVIQLYEESLEIVPSSAALSVHLALGDLYRSRDELEQAMAHYREAIALDPQAPEAHHGLAVVYRSLGEREQYESEWDTYQELERNSGAQ